MAPRLARDAAEHERTSVDAAPQAVLQALRQAEGDDVSVVAAVATDIDLAGRYAREWMIATRQTIWVIPETSPTEGRRIAFSEITELRTVAVVGSGLLQARHEGVWVDVVRFSNTRKYPFGRVVRTLEQLRQGEAAEVTPEELRDPRRCSTCGLMLQYAGETCPRCVNKGAAFNRILDLMKPHWKLAAVMMSLLLVGIGLDMVSPLLTRFLVDDVLQVESTEAVASAPPGAQVHLLMMVVGVLALVQVMRAMVNVFNGRIASIVGNNITFDVRGRLVAHLQRLGLNYFDKQQVGSLVGRVAYDTEALQGFMSQLTSGFLMQLLMVLFSVIFMFTLSPGLAIWTLAPAPFLVGGMWLFYNYIYPRYHRFYDRSNKQAGMLSGMLTGIRVVKAFAQEDRELKRFEESSAKLRDARRSVDASAATFYPLMSILFQIGGWLIWYIGGGQVLDERLSLGTLMAFFGYLGMFYGPLASLTNLTTWVTQFTTQVQRIFEVLDTPVAVRSAKDARRLPEMAGRIEFQRVNFGYSRGSPVLKDLSLTIEAGQSIGFVGRSGCGKTTIINLIGRFYDIDDGELLIDGVNIRQLDINDLRSQTAVVLQEPFLFRGTLWENLVYGRPDASKEEVLASTRAAAAHEFIMRQYHGYDTWIGERGAGLSGGERQRMSIARALLCNPRVLILDEATSALDSESELLIQKALRELIRGRTSILIAHRLSTLRHCDRIFVIDHGRVVEQGAHRELMNLNGRYARLVKLQSEGASDGVVDSLLEHEKEKEREAKLEAETFAPDVIDPDTGLGPIRSHHLRWLTPENTRIHLGNLSALHATVLNEGIYHGVFALRCFPVRHPYEYISLVYTNSEGEDQEVGLIRNLADWPAEAQELVRLALKRRYFVHEIKRVHRIEPFQNFLNFRVTTDNGEHQFVIRSSSEAATEYGQGGRMLLDLEENRFLIRDLSKLPTADRQLFERHVYW